MRVDAQKYIPSLQVRITNLYNRTKWKAGAYLLLIKLSDELALIRHDLSNGEDVNNRMLSLNRKLITQEGQAPGKRFVRSAQSRANWMVRL